MPNIYEKCINNLKLDRQEWPGARQLLYVYCSVGKDIAAAPSGSANYYRELITDFDLRFGRTNVNVREARSILQKAFAALDKSGRV